MRTRAFLFLVICIVSGQLVTRASAPAPRAMLAPFSGFPMAIGDWRGYQQPPFDADTLRILGVDDYLTRVYIGPSAGLGLYIGYWGSQRQGDTIHSPLNCLPGAGWEPVSKNTLQIDLAGAARTPGAISVNRYIVQKGLDRQLVLYWYQSHGRIVASEYLSRAYLVGDAIRLHRTDAALVRIMVPIHNDASAETTAEREGVRFVRTLVPALGGYLPS
jgi:EpsI family protein